MNTIFIKTQKNIVLLMVMYGIINIQACKKAKEIEYETSWKLVNEEVFHIMKEYYLWYKVIPKNKDMSVFSHPMDAMNALIDKSKDRWSFVITKKEYNDLFGTNLAVAYGFS
ncbi:MAG: hypothetical protein SNJ71_08300, partial [Bacteroidales bacterium]